MFNSMFNMNNNLYSGGNNPLNGMMNPGMSYMPHVYESTPVGERAYDMASYLLKQRIIILGSAIDDSVANAIVMQLLILEKEDPTAPIWLYINSPGGSISAGLAIHDTMNKINAPVYTLCMGMAASMGAFLLGAGEKGHRYSLPYATIMIHQPLGGAQGQATEIEISAKRILYLKELMAQLIATHSGQDIETVRRDCDRDNYMTSQEALEYGLIDEVVDTSVPLLDIVKPSFNF